MQYWSGQECKRQADKLLALVSGDGDARRIKSRPEASITPRGAHPALRSMAPEANVRKDQNHGDSCTPE